MAIIYFIVGFVHLDAPFRSPMQSLSVASLSRETSWLNLTFPARTWVRTELRTLIFNIFRFKHLFTFQFGLAFKPQRYPP